MVAVNGSAIELTDAQETILTKLVNIYNKNSGNPVKGKDIAAAIDRNPGTIRTQMQSLKSLQLVHGIPGPKGGYEPTANAYK
ncbi:MAG: Rrf2 family transcriptional regulator, partial [Halobacteriaceae archaeon]